MAKWGKKSRSMFEYRGGGKSKVHFIELNAMLYSTEVVLQMFIHRLSIKPMTMSRISIN